MKVCPKCGKQYADDANFCTNDAGRLVAMSASVPAAAAAAGPTLLGGRFELREQVGSGATGAVHRATDTQTGAQVAVKLVAPAVVAQQAQRVERELKLLEKVQHAAVARVLGSGRQGDQVWVAMEWVDGAPLARQVAAGGVEPERASELTLAIGAALVEAARVGVVHRDLSPDNVLVTAGGIKLINFALPLPGERVAGAPAFVSPEVIEGKPVDQRSSTYSLGALYYFLLTGQPPFSGEPHTVHAAHLSGSALPPSQRAAVAADVDSLVGRAMDRNPAKRYLTLKQFLDDIERVRRGPEGGTSSTAPFGRAGLGGSSGAGKRREPAATMLGVGALNEARTRQMDIEIPPEALREAAALDAAVSGQAAPGGAPATTARMGSVAPPAETVSQAIAAHAASAAFVATEPVPAPAPIAPVAPVVPVVAPPVVAPPVVAAPSAAVAASASPWAPPAGPPSPAGPMTPAAHAVEAAAPGMAAAAHAPPPAAASLAPAAPVVPAAARVSPAVTQPGAGKKKQDAKDKKAAKGKFRETMWFKKGELDAAAAEAAAQNPEGVDADKADSLPMEDRYSDDGTITTGDAARYSLKTGHTGAMPAMRDVADPSSSVSEGDLIGEMKGGSRLLLILIAIAVLAAIGLVVAFAL